MTRRCHISFRVLALAVLASAPLSVAAGQDSTRTVADSSRPTADLLRVAREAADNLRYAETKSTALSVLSMTGATLPERVEALQLAALASFAEEDSAGRNEAVAVNLLRQRHRLVPFRGLDRRYTWPGLDALDDKVRASMVVVDAAADSIQTSVSTEGRIRVSVRATRAATWRLVAESAGRERTLDSLPDAIANGMMAFATFDGTQVTLPAGSYRLLVIGSDGPLADTARLEMSLDAPAFNPALPPVPLTNASFEPESRRPVGIVKGLLGGLAIGGITYAAASQVRLDEPLKSGLVANGTANVAVGMIVVGAAVLGRLDPGMPDYEARERNAKVRRDFAEASVAADVETARRRAAYVATASIGWSRRGTP